MANLIIPPSAPPAQEYDQFDWPINPATGESYSYEELVADGSLPLPRNKTAAGLIQKARDRAAGKAQPPKRKKSKPRRSRSRRRKKFTASSVLAKMNLSGAEQQTEDRGKAMAEQVERVNQTRAIFVTSGGQTTVMEVV